METLCVILKTMTTPNLDGMKKLLYISAITNESNPRKGVRYIYGTDLMWD